MSPTPWTFFNNKGFREMVIIGTEKNTNIGAVGTVLKEKSTYTTFPLFFPNVA